MLALTLILLLPQGTPNPTDAVGSLPAPLLAAEIAAPQQLMGTLLDSRFQQQFLESPIWTTLQELPQYPMASVAWDTFLAPAGGNPSDFFAALSGSGAVFFMTPGAVAGAFDFSLLTSGHDGDLAQDCLAPLLGFAGIGRAQMAGEAWQVQLDNLTLQRVGDRFALGTNAALLQKYLQLPFADLRKHAIPAVCRSAADQRGAPNVLWLSGDLLRAKGYAALPEDVGASYFLGDAHEVLRTAPWLGISLRLAAQEVVLEAFAPAAASLKKSHAPFFPTPYEVPMPQLGNLVVQGVLTRDLGVWWTSRDLYMQERAVVESVEADGTLALLFGRDPGSEIFAWLESDIRLLAAVLPEEDRRGLPIEYPAGAIGLRIKEDAPEDLGDSFASAFLAAVTFANLEGGGMAQQPMLLNIEQTEEGSLYSAKFRSPPQGQALAARHNLSPSLYIGKDGAIWISSSLSLLQEIAAAPHQMVAAHGLWFDFEVPQLREILERDRNILVANRLLEEGGNMEAATQYVDMMMAGLAIFDTASLQSRLENGFLSMQLLVRATP
jgi:hypothetical protein